MRPQTLNERIGTRDESQLLKGLYTTTFKLVEAQNVGTEKGTDMLKVAHTEMNVLNKDSSSHVYNSKMHASIIWSLVVAVRGGASIDLSFTTVQVWQLRMQRNEGELNV